MFFNFTSVYSNSKANDHTNIAPNLVHVMLIMYEDAMQTTYARNSLLWGWSLWLKTAYTCHQGSKGCCMLFFTG